MYEPSDHVLVEDYKPFVVGFSSIISNMYEPSDHVLVEDYKPFKSLVGFT